MIYFIAYLIIGFIVASITTYYEEDADDVTGLICFWPLFLLAVCVKAVENWFTWLANRKKNK